MKDLLVRFFPVLLEKWLGVAAGLGVMVGFGIAAFFLFSEPEAPPPPPTVVEPVSPDHPEKLPEEDREHPEAKAEIKGLELLPVTFDSLPGWAKGKQAAVLPALRRSCERRLSRSEPAAPQWRKACAAVQEAELELEDHGAVRTLLEQYFVPFAIRFDGRDTGLFTGYFEAEIHGSRERTDQYRYPLYARPDDLIAVNPRDFNGGLCGHTIMGRVQNGRLVPYPDREALESGLLDGRGLELLWVKDPVSLFLLQVQGSGRVLLPDGAVVRIGFAGHNGRPYRSIGRYLMDDGALPPGQASWGQIRHWLEQHPEEMRKTLHINPRYVFFRILEGMGEGPIGTEGVPLSPGRSLAVDREFIPLGTPLWLDTVMPGMEGTPLRRLVVAQDTGGAIKGAVRGDLFWGYGAEALAQAGRMKSPGRYFLLLPKSEEENQ